MALFNEVNSLLFNVLVRLHREVCEGKIYTRRALHEEILKAFPPDSDSQNAGDLLFSQRDENAVLDMLFDFDSASEKAVANARVNLPIPTVFSQLERRWMKSFLLDEQAQFLLSQELRKKLLGNLENVGPLPLELWEKKQAVGDDAASEPLKSFLRVIWQALREKRKIEYRNLTAGGVLREDVAAPCRLEYNVAMNRYYVIVWNYQEKRAIKILVSRLQSVKLTDLKVSEELLTKTFPRFLKSRQCSVTLKLLDKNNALDRCLNLFASYDKEEAYIADDGSCHLKIVFYEFDRAEVKEKILTLGSAAIVIEPLDLRDDIVSVLQDVYKWYKD